jgi:hypothetical protein
MRKAGEIDIESTRPLQDARGSGEELLMHSDVTSCSIVDAKSRKKDERIGDEDGEVTIFSRDAQESGCFGH